MNVMLLGLLLFAEKTPQVAEVAPSYWIVVSPETKLMAGDEPKGKLAPGTLLRCSKESGNWRFSVEYRGWVHSNDLVALDKAVEFFSELISKQPTAAAFHHRGIAHAALLNWDQALADFTEAAARGDTSVELLVNQGNAQRNLNKSGLAIESYTKAIKENPKATYALLHRGSLLAEMGHWDASLKDLELAAELSPESSEVQNHLGVTLRMLGRFDEAVQAYSKAIEIVPGHALAYGNRGYALKCLGKYKEALADYEQSISLDADAIDVKNDLAWLLATCPDESLRDPARAVSLAQEVDKATKSENADFLDTLAAAHASAEQYEEAVRIAEKSLGLIAGNPGFESIAERLKLYQEKKPYREPPPTEE